MKVQIKYISIMAVVVLLFTACNKSAKNQEKTATNNAVVQTTNTEKVKLADEPKKGDFVKNNLVCMVNNKYMGKEQLVVAFQGKTYYGCCEMCKKRIPEDETVRYAIDPQTSKKVDKATAYIVLIGNNGEVAYFENKKSFNDFKAMASLKN